MNSGSRSTAFGRMRPVMLAVYLAISFSAFGAETQTAVIPSGYETVPGRTSAPILGGEGRRYMGVYHPADFITAMPLGGAIRTIAFRVNEQSSPAERRFDYEDVEIRMSTIPPPDTPLSSHVFDDYVGFDEIVVFRGAIHWETEILPGGVVNPFDLKVDLQREFDYDPRVESLVIDIRTFKENLTDSLRVDSLGYESKSFSLSGSISLPEAVSFFNNPPIMEVTFVPGRSQLQPKVAILWPTPTNTYTFAEGIRLKIKAGVDLVNVEKINFYADDALIGEITAPPYNLIWDATRSIGNSNGIVNLKAVAVDPFGAVFESLQVPIVVRSGGEPPAPIVEIVSPRPFDVFPSGGGFQFEAEVLASLGDAGPVEFFVDGRSAGRVDAGKLLTKDAEPSRVLVPYLERGDHLLSVKYGGVNGNSCLCPTTDRIVRVTDLAIDPYSLQLTDDDRVKFTIVTRKTQSSTLVQRSTNMQTWTTITNFVPYRSRFPIEDLNPGKGPNSYRVIVP